MQAARIYASCSHPWPPGARPCPVPDLEPWLWPGFLQLERAQPWQEPCGSTEQGPGTRARSKDWGKHQARSGDVPPGHTAAPCLLLSISGDSSDYG